MKNFINTITGKVVINKGDRVIIEYQDEYFVGTITTIRENKIYLKFDDGDNGKASIYTRRILGLTGKDTVKQGMSKDQAIQHLLGAEKVYVEMEKEFPIRSVSTSKGKDRIQVRFALKTTFDKKFEKFLKSNFKYDGKGKFDPVVFPEDEIAKDNCTRWKSKDGVNIFFKKGNRDFSSEIKISQKI